MVWTLRITQIVQGVGNKVPTQINYTFTKPRLLVKCECTSALPQWYRAGWITQAIALPGIGDAIELKSYIAPLGQKIFDLAPEPEYSILFEAVHYVHEVTVTIWEDV